MTLKVRFAAHALVLVAGVHAAAAQYFAVDNRLLLGWGASYGNAIAAGDFDGDGYPDLAVGAPFAGTDEQPSLGRVYLYRGGRDRTFEQWGLAWEGQREGDQTGRALAVGDFDNDGIDELAVASDGVEVSGEPGAGVVDVIDFFEGAWRVVQRLSQNDVAATGPESWDRFGRTLTTGDFDGNGYDDLVVGVPLEATEVNYAGVVHVFSAGPAGLTEHDTYVAGQNGLHGSPLFSAMLGESLAAGDFNGDGYDDLAMGAPYRYRTDTMQAGEVHVLYGSAAGLTLNGQMLLSDSEFPEATSEAYEYFGAALAAGNFDESVERCFYVGCSEDLVIGVPGQDIGGAVDAGKVLVVYGSAAGLQLIGATTITQGDAHSTPETGDYFGYALAAGLADHQHPSVLTGDLVVGAACNGAGTSFGCASGGEDYFASDDGYIQLFFGVDTDGLHAGRDEQGIAQWPEYGIAPAQDNDRWGQIMVMADFDRDGHGDLAVGVPNKYLGDGAVQILFGALFASGFESGTVDGGWSTN